MCSKIKIDCPLDHFNWNKYYEFKGKKTGVNVIHSIGYGAFCLNHLVKKYNVKTTIEAIMLVEQGVLDKDEIFLKYAEYRAISKQTLYYCFIEYLI